MSDNMLGHDALAQVAGPFKTFFERLQSPDGAEWLAAFKRFLRKENPWEMVKQKAVKREFKTWKVIKLGTHESIKFLQKALEKAEFRISDWAADILPKTALSETEVEIELVRVTVGELGFEKGATLEEIYERALGSGLALCPAEVGPQLCLQYADQPNGEYLLIAMEPATNSDGDLIVFNVNHDDDGRWLNARNGDLVSRWNASFSFVFARRK